MTCYYLLRSRFPVKFRAGPAIIFGEIIALDDIRIPVLYVRTDHYVSWAVLGCDEGKDFVITDNNTAVTYNDWLNDALRHLYCSFYP